MPARPARARSVVSGIKLYATVRRCHRATRTRRSAIGGCATARACRSGTFATRTSRSSGAAAAVVSAGRSATAARTTAAAAGARASGTHAASGTHVASRAGGASGASGPAATSAASSAWLARREAWRRERRAVDACGHAGAVAERHVDACVIVVQFSHGEAHSTGRIAERLPDAHPVEG